MGPEHDRRQRRPRYRVLKNELYLGRLVWNRLRYVKDPATGKRVSRLNDAQQWVAVEVPELRIVDDELWQAAKARQAATTSKVEGTAKAVFWDRRRPRYLFSGLMRCGLCGGGFAKISLRHFGCSTARNKGTCADLLTIRRDVLEATVLDALRHRLMEDGYEARAAIRALVEAIVLVPEETASWLSR